MSWTFCTSGAAVVKAGQHANSLIAASGAILAGWSDEAEGYICTQCHTDFVTNYSGLNTQIKNSLRDASSSYIAMNIITFDPTGYLNREADALLNLHNGIVDSNIQKLKEKENQRLSS